MPQSSASPGDRHWGKWAALGGGVVLALCTGVLLLRSVDGEDSAVFRTQDFIAALEKAGIEIVQVSEVPIGTNALAVSEVAVCTTREFDEWVQIHEHRSHEDAMKAFPGGVYSFGGTVYPSTVTGNLGVFLTLEHSMREKVLEVARAMR